MAFFLPLTFILSCFILFFIFCAVNKLSKNDLLISAIQYQLYPLKNMKKLLFIFALAAICTITTSSFDPLGSSNTMVMQTIANTSRTETGTKEQPTKVNKQKTLDIISQCCRSAAVA